LVIWLLPLYGQPLMSPVARLAPLLTIALITWLMRQPRQPGRIFRQGPRSHIIGTHKIGSQSVPPALAAPAAPRQG
jgi:hypothetical protein